MSNITLINEDTPVIPLNEIKRFIRDCLTALKAPEEHADIVANVLVEADQKGHYSHGMNKLEMYINDIKAGIVNTGSEPKILKETAATAWVDGQNGLGAVVGEFCMKLAIQKAKDVGIGWVACKGSNHFGICGHYAILAQRENLIGFSCTNSSPTMVPTRAKKAAVGTNPLSLAVPTGDEPGMVLDMATTTVAIGKVEIQRKKNASLPPGWALDDDGLETTNAFKGRSLYPLGGAEINSGYKGYGLGLLVEVFSGLLGGTPYGPNRRYMGDTTRIADVGHTFFAIDPNCFAPNFEERMQDLAKSIRNLESVESDKPVLIPGDPEQIHMKDVAKFGGVRYLKTQLDICNKLAYQLNVSPLSSCKK